MPDIFFEQYVLSFLYMFYRPKHYAISGFFAFHSPCRVENVQKKASMIGNIYSKKKSSKKLLTIGFLLLQFFKAVTFKFGHELNWALDCH